MTNTFRFRLALIYFSVTAVFIIIFASVIYLFFKKDTIKTVDGNLLAKARVEIERNIKDVTGTGKFEMETIKRSGNEYHQVSSLHGDISITSLRTRNLSWPVDMKLIEKAFKGNYSFDTVPFRGEMYRVLYFPVDESRILRLGYSLQEINAGLTGLKNLFFFFLPLILITTATVSYYIAGKAILPVVKLTETADKIKKGVLKERIVLDFPGLEIKNLVRIFNDMLGSIQKHVESHKRFTSDVSHEVRSPLTVLKGTIEVALRKRRDPEEYEDILKKSLFEVNRLQKIAENLLLLSRADYNIIELRKTWFDINELLSLVVERHKKEILEKSLTVVEEYQESMEFLGDKELLDEALSNLFENAIKYTPESGTVFLKTEQTYDGTTVSFQDSGPGIPEKDTERIFERFYRVDKTRSRLSGGSGLGLAITKWIIETHKGNISVEHSDEGGAIFIITLPADNA